MTERAEHDYSRFVRAIADVARPCAFVDRDAFDRNAARIFDMAGEKPLRVATKSIRSPALLARIVELAKKRGRTISFMTYSARETAFLHERGFDDFLLAYPVATAKNAQIVAALARSGATVAVAVDDPAHLALLQGAATREDTTIRVVVDVDVSYRPLPLVHLGVRRSPLRHEDAPSFAARVGAHPRLELAGVMAYEAQIAGVGDLFPGARLRSELSRAMRILSRRDVERARRALVGALERGGKSLSIVNGGGTGNLPWCAREDVLTEVTAGSGFLCSHLFDRYRDVPVEPAAYFALDVVRVPARGFVTCAGGGFVASGAHGSDRLPIPVLPRGLALLPLEGAGEVQTPLRVRAKARLEVGAPVIFRHAKAGELAEHFAEYLLVANGRVEDRVATYRGEGQAFSG